MMIPLPSAIRGILFDKDGTLIDYAATWGPINQDLALYAARGDQSLADDILRAGGYDPRSGIVTAGSPLAAGPLDQLIGVFQRAANGMAPPDLAAVMERRFRDGGGRHAVLLPGVADAIARFHAAGVVLGIATNDTEAGARASLGRVNLLEPFTFLAGCDSGYGAKPGPGMAMGFAAATGLSPAQIAVVGDSVHDLEMGHAAGCGYLVGVLCGTSARGDLEPAAHVVIDGIGQLVAARAV